MALRIESGVTISSGVRITSWIGSDPYFYLTTLLLNDNSSSGSSWIADASTNNLALTVNGDAKASSITPFNTGWSVYFGGSGNYVVGNAAVITQTTTTFTIEGWIYPTIAAVSTSNVPGLIGDMLPTSATNAWSFGTLASGAVSLYWYDGVAKNATTTGTVSLNQWSHIAVSVNANSISIYINGTQQTLTGTTTLTNRSQITNTVAFGQYATTNSIYYGYISNFSVLSGTAKYSSATITVPTAALSTSTTNQTLLFASVYNFTDSNTATTAKTFTITGSPSIQYLNPFGTALVGGSGYFNGTTDYLSATITALGLSNFTIEFYFYLTRTGVVQVLWDTRTPNTTNLGFDIYVTAANILTVSTASFVYITGTTTIGSGRWYHLAMIRSSVSVIQLYLNGVQEGSNSAYATSSQNFTNTSLRLGYGVQAGYFQGYMSNVRVINGAAQYTAAFTPSTTPLTPISYTSLLTLQNAQPTNNSSFTDDSQNNFVITRNGNTTQGTFTPFSQTGWSVNFNTSTTYLTVTDTATLRFGASNFTIEAWVYLNSIGSVQTIASKGASTPTGWVLQISAANKLVFIDTSTSITGATSLVANTWYYVAVVRAGIGANQTTLYLNAVSDATGTSATTFSQTTNMLIGADRSSLNFFNGYISNIRLSSTNRTISSTSSIALTADANTIFLALHNNRYQYTDNTAAYTSMTVTGTPSVQSFSPFAPTSTYTTSLVGGSAYFDGTGDYLQYPANDLFTIGSSNFTVEAWIYVTGGAGAQREIVARHNSGVSLQWMLELSSGNAVNFYVQGTSGGEQITSDTTVALNQWVHVAGGINGVNKFVCLNGVYKSAAYTSIPSSTAGTTIALTIGATVNTNYLFTGYISNVRIVKGTAVYTGTFAVPIAPLSISGATSASAYSSTTNVNITFPSYTCSLLSNFTNASIYDSTGKNNLETIGTTQVSTVQSKFGGASLKFNGTSDYLIYPYKNVYDPDITQAASFTVDFWIYFNTVASVQSILDTRNNGSQGWEFRLNAGGTLVFYSTGQSSVTTTTTLAAGTWYYIEAVKNASVMTIYINGVDGGGSGAYGSASAVANPMTIGGRNSSANAFLNGYIEDLRITRGVARTITVPTIALYVQ